MVRLIFPNRVLGCFWLLWRLCTGKPKRRTPRRLFGGKGAVRCAFLVERVHSTTPFRWKGRRVLAAEENRGNLVKPASIAIVLGRGPAGWLAGPRRFRHGSWSLLRVGEEAVFEVVDVCGIDGLTLEDLVEDGQKVVQGADGREGG